MLYSIFFAYVLVVHVTNVNAEILPSANCPEDYEEIGGRCLMVQEAEVPNSWDDAKAACCECGGTLATIANVELFEELEESGCMNDSSLWVGGYRRGAGFAWVVDGEGFGEWAQGNTEHTECTHSNCAKIESSGLVAEKCNEKLGGYICETVNEDPTAEECTTGWEYLEETDSCYKTFTQSISYIGDAACSTLSLAQMTCVKEGGSLASVRSDEEKEMIQCLAGNVPAWIGLSETVSCGLSWADGMDSVNASHYLRAEKDDKKVLPSCGLMLTVNNVSSLVMDACDVHYDQFVCSKPACAELEPSCSCFGCPEGWFEDSGTQNCYNILCEEPVSYEESKIKCAAEGAFVTSILDENDYKFVKDLLTTFDEEKAYIGMILATAENPKKVWEDGTKVVFNKLEGNATGQCVVIDKAGQYLSVDCTEPLPVVCRKTRGPIESEEQ